jgi:hypothetical protein
MYLHVYKSDHLLHLLLLLLNRHHLFSGDVWDYVWINKFIEFIQNYIPIVFNELEGSRGEVFCDLDMTHAFHQIVLSECTSRMLTVNPLGSGQLILC